MDRTQLEQLLLQRLEANTERVKQANDIVTKFSKQPGALPLLFDLMCTSEHWAARQLAALYIKRVVAKSWIRHDAATQEQFKTVLIQRVVLETDRRVRGSIAEVASEIAKFLVPSNQWPALLQFLDESSRSPSPDHREVAMMLFERLIEHVGDTLRAHFPQFTALFGAALNDPASLPVRVAALKALGMLVQYLHTPEELLLASQHIPVMMEILLQCVQQLGGDEDTSGTLIASFELLDDFLENPAPVLASHLPSVIEALLKIAGARELDRSVRERAINFFYFAALRKPKMLTKTRLMARILEVLCQVLCEAEDEHEAETSTHELAGQAINMMCTHLPNKHIFPVLAQFVSQALPHQDPLVRKAAVSALTIAAEGCHGPMRDNLPSVVPQVVQCCQDPHLQVRESSCVCIGQFAEFLQPEINDHYQIVLPALFRMLEDSSTQVQEKSCYALYNFCECLEDKIVPYLQELCSKLVLIVTGHPKRDVQEMAVAALASVMAAAKDAVRPFAEDVLQVLKVLMQQTGDSELKLRARATECAGVLGVMLGKEVFSKVAQEYIDLALQGMQSSFPELREYTYGFFSNMGEVFGAEFAPMLETIVPLALTSLAQLDHEDVADDGAVELGEDSDTDGESEAGRKRMQVRTDLLDEKAAAAQMLGNLAEAVGQGFAPHVDACMEALELASDYMHPDVRTNVHVALGSMMKCMHLTLGSPEWVPGLLRCTGPPDHPEQGVFALPIQVRRHNNTALVVHLNALACEFDKEVVSKAADTLTQTMELLGPEVIASNAEDLGGELLSLLRGKAPCQTDEGSDDEDADTEEDHDDVLMEAVMDLVIAFAKVSGPEFQPAFEHMFKPILKFTRPGNDSKDRVMSIGAFAEIVKSLGTEAAVLPFMDRLLPVASAGLSDADHEVRRNAAFCAGMLCLRAPSRMIPHYPGLLEKVCSLLNDKHLEVVDNSCGALAAMITASLQSVPLATVLPLLLSKLPLQADLEEIPTVCTGLLVLLDGGDAAVLAPHLPKILEVLFASLLADPQQLKGELLARVIAGAKSVTAGAPDAAKAAVETFDPEDRTRIGSILQ